ncbi:MAG: RDD family protein, partial [Planctomycetota bacterium]
DLPPGLSQIVSRCLSKEPGSRYGSYAALRDALLPLSSAVAEPATQAQRTAAGWIDYLAAFLPTYAALMVLVGPESLFIRPLYDFSFDAWRYHLLLLASGVGYFTVVEGVWGAGLGKWVMNLRVVGRNGRSPGVVRALVRMLIPIGVIEGIRVPLSVALAPAEAWGVLDVTLFIGLSIACPWVAALLWLTARRSNGFAALWDLSSGTRVVVRPRGSRRPAAPVAPEPAEAVGPSRRIGPFRVESDVVPGRWLSGEDQVLKRRVWLRKRSGQALTAARRSVARPGRSRWLQEILADGEAWDVYEAGRGTPLSVQTAAGSLRWSVLRFWLHDVASELRAAERDGTLAPAYGFDNVWITDDGRAVLLDEPWPIEGPRPGAVSVGSVGGKQRFLSQLADRVDPLSVPLHARPVLENLRSASFEKITFVAGTLRGLLNKPSDVSRGLRAASLFVIPGYATVATFLGIASSTPSASDPVVWAGRVGIAVFVMMHFIALSDIVLAFWQKSTGLSTFGLEAVTGSGCASRVRLLLRAGVMWLPVLAPSGGLVAIAILKGTWIDTIAAAQLGWVLLAASLVYSISALLHPNRGVHDRLAGVWVGRR